MSAPGDTPTVTVLHVVAGGPDGEIRYVTSLVDGALEVLGADAGAEPDVTLTTPHAEALAISRGELHPNVAFMRGRTKTTGPTGPLLAVLAADPGDGYRAAVEAILTSTG